VEAAPEAILLDVVMPGKDGPATLAGLRDDTATRDIPVIFVTADDRSHAHDHLPSLGAAGVIAKPFDVQRLGDQVAGILDRGARP
jgi:CheY-like chemotaxis protein